MIFPICVISLYCNIKHLFETWKYMYKSGSSDDKCIDSQHFGTCDSHTDFNVKRSKVKVTGWGAYCGGHLAAQLVDFTEDQQLMSEHLHTMIYHNWISAEGYLTNEDEERLVTWLTLRKLNWSFEYLVIKSPFLWYRLQRSRYTKSDS